MMNRIWVALISVAFLVSIFTGRIEQTASAAMEGANEAVQTSVSVLGIMCFWMGMMRIAEKAELLNRFSNLLKPLITKLFRGVRRDETRKAILMNITANLLGLGNAATPFGLKAMELMEKENGKKGVATNDMCLFVVINTASIQLIPTTLFALRSSYGSEKPYIVLPCVWLVSVAAAVLGILTAKHFEKRR
ncbi:MAG: hypothetical protein IJE10_03445 [Clostridia bacterium]|nr:hypothetical protein [Clostridia bacterium]